MTVGRIAEITRVFIEEGLGAVTEADGTLPSELALSPDAEKGRRLRRAFERLGPTFVKFGQLLATRVDLFDEEFLAELRQLRAHVPPIEPGQALGIVERELGRPYAEVFSRFGREPVASASIAQVHRATLRDSVVDEREVAVKVQRPNLATSLLADLDVMMRVSKFLDGLVPAYRRSLVHRVAEEYAMRARNEIDFLVEAAAMDRFRAVIATLDGLSFRIPRVHFDWTSPRLLVMEWLDGTLLDDVTDAEHLAALGFSPEQFAVALLRLQLSMSYEHGLIHGDTHPGNLILCHDGQIGLIDFGLHGHVGLELRDKMLELLFHQTSGRIDEAVEAFSAVFTPGPDTDRVAFERELREVLSPASSPLAKDARLTAQLIEGLRVGARHQLKVRSELFLVLRNLTIIEGIVVKFAPNLDLVAEVREILEGILRRRLAARRIGDDLEKFLPLWLLTMAQRPQFVDRVLRLERVFTESKNLGDFLRREGVIRDEPKARGVQVLTWFSALLLGAAVGAAMLWVWFRGGHG